MMSILVLLALLSRSALAIPELSQVFVISRHGSRSRLLKSADVLQESGEVLLTPLGEMQLYNLGVWLRQRYGPSGLNLLDKYDANQVRFESSDLERTVSSAHALSLGLFPPDSRGSVDSLLPDGIYQSIPVFMSELRNDVHIRAYEKCPRFFQNLDALYASANWTSVEIENKAFLTNLTSIEAFKAYQNIYGFIPLTEIWNIYDLVNVVRIECAQDPDVEICSELESLSDVPETWNKLQSLAHYAELARYSRDTAGDMLAGNLLLKIHEQMRAPKMSDIPAHGNEFVNRKFYHYSAHYPTLLGIFATLGLEPPSISVIPDYGASVIFEFYKDEATGEDEVFLLYKEGGVTQEVSVRLPGPCSAAFACRMTDFTQILQGFSYSTPGEWCVVCGNSVADVCLAEELEILRSKPSQSVTNATPTLAPQPFPVMAPTLAPQMSFDPTTPVQMPSDDSNPFPMPVSDINPDIPKETITCPTNNNTPGAAIAGAFAGGVGLGLLLLVAIQYLMSLRTGIEKGDTDSDNPDNIIDLDFSDRHA